MSNGLKFLWKDSSPNDEIKKQVEANTNDIATINTKFNDYYTKTQVATSQAGQDALIQENMTNIENLQNDKLDKNAEISGAGVSIIELGNNKVMVIAQADIRNNLSQGADLYNNLPEAVKDLRNVSDIEYFEYNFIQNLNGKNKVFTNAIANIAATVYSNRIYLRNEANIPGYIQYIRFKLIYNKVGG